MSAVIVEYLNQWLNWLKAKKREQPAYGTLY